MEEIFNHLTPFIRIIESNEIQSHLVAIQVLLDLPPNDDTIIPSTKRSEEIGVLENTEGGYLYIAYDSDEYFRRTVSKIATQSLVLIDKSITGADSKVEIQNKLEHYIDYVNLLLLRFDKKEAKVKKLLAAIPEHFDIILNAIKDRKAHFSDSARRTTSSPSDHSIIKRFKQKENYESFLSTREIAILIHAMVDMKLIPAYSQERLAEIGYILFGKNSQNIRDEYGKIMSNPHFHKKELNSLIEVFSQFVSSLEEWQNKKS